MSQILANFLLLCLCTAVSGLYFHIAETEKKCFIEEIPDDTIVVGKYCLRSQKVTGAGATHVESTIDGCVSVTRQLCQHKVDVWQVLVNDPI